MIRKHVMGRFTNGNYYSHILEIALIAEESGNTFHSYVPLNSSVPKRVQQLPGITNKTIKSVGLPFSGVMDELVVFFIVNRCIVKRNGHSAMEDGYIS